MEGRGPVELGTTSRVRARFRARNILGQRWGLP